MGLRRALLVAALVGSVLGGCGNDAPAEKSASWPTTSSPLDRPALTWAVGPVVHLGTTRRIDVGTDISTFVVAGDGVFFTRTQDPAGDGSYSGDQDESDRPLFYSDGDKPARQVAPSAATLRVSPHGRYLGFLDLATGERDAAGTAQIQTVVVDLETGQEVVRSAEGMGDPGSDDLGAAYPESPPQVLRLDDGTAYVDTFDRDVLAFDLTTGQAETASEPIEDFDLPPYDDRRNPSGDARIVDQDNHRDRFAAAGKQIPLTGVAGKVDLIYWLDDRTAVGAAVDVPGTPLVTCQVRTGRCVQVPNTTGEDFVWPSGLLGY